LLLAYLSVVAECALFYRDFSSSRGFRFLGYSRHNPINKTMEIIREDTYANKKHKVCAIWTKRKVYWHEGFELKFVFRMRTPDASNNGGEGFALVLQQDRELAVGDLRSKGERPPIDGKTYFPAGLGFNELRKSWAIKFDMDPQTTDPSNKPHLSIHSGGDWINPSPSRAFTYDLPPMNNNHNHTVKIFYDIEPSGGVLRVYWMSDHHGNYTWGTWRRPVLQTEMTMPDLDKRPAWLGFTSATGFLKTQTVDIVALTMHEIRHINGNGQKCIVCGGINPRCCLHWEMMKEEKDSNKPSFCSGDMDGRNDCKGGTNTANQYVGQDWPAPNENPRVWDKEEWY